ncbi:AfsR/SARP family transcriptional regulator [Streptomyces asiaticus]|uniref:AfsR/SARP family transcriptional regulator n=2 Tax=Streptomyces TaxID=1883 RepID=UPI003D7050B0
MSSVGSGVSVAVGSRIVAGPDLSSRRFSPALSTSATVRPRRSPMPDLIRHREGHRETHQSTCQQVTGADMLEFRILGPPVVKGRGGVRTPQGPFQATLLISLLVADGRPVQADDLIHELWGNGRPTHPDNALHAHISRLRRVLEKLEPEPSQSRIISRPGGYQLAVDDASVDAISFVSEVSDIEAMVDHMPPQEAAGQLRQVLDRWQGPIFGGITGGRICQASAKRYEETRLHACTMLFDAELASGHHSAIIAELRALLTSYSGFYELHCEQLMIALYRSGRQAEALEAYRQGRDVIDHFTSRPPSVRLRRCEHMVLVQDPRLTEDTRRAVLTAL